MRTTVTIDDDLLRRAKALALKSGRTLGAVIEDALRETLARSRKRSAGDRPPLPVFDRGTGVAPGVDLDDTAGLLDLMEGR